MSKKVEQYFKEFPASDKVFETTDGVLFHQEGDANLYQPTVGKGKVKVHYRTEPASVKNDDSVNEAVSTTKAEFTDVVVTQELIDLNPELVEQSVKVGETIQVPVTETEAPQKKAPAKKASSKKNQDTETK